MNNNHIFMDIELPEVLSQSTINEYIIEAQKGNQDARDKVILHNIKLVISIVKKRYSNSSYDKNDLVSLGIIGLLRAVDLFDVSKNFSFSTYATRCINSEIINFFKNNKKHLNVKSLEESIGYNSDGDTTLLLDCICSENALVEDEVIQKISYEDLYEEIEKLGSKESEILKLYFGFEGNVKTQREIGNIFGFSGVYAGVVIKKSLLKLKKNLETKHIPKKKEVRKEPKTIYEYFKEYNRVEINEMLASLNETEKYLLTSKYGLDLDNPKSNENWNDEYEGVFNELLIPKMEKVLRKNNF